VIHEVFADRSNAGTGSRRETLWRNRRDDPSRRHRDGDDRDVPGGGRGVGLRAVRPRARGPGLRGLVPGGHGEPHVRPAAGLYGTNPNTASPSSPTRSPACRRASRTAGTSGRRTAARTGSPAPGSRKSSAPRSCCSTCRAERSFARRRWSAVEGPDRHRPGLEPLRQLPSLDQGKGWPGALGFRGTTGSSPTRSGWGARVPPAGAGASLGAHAPSRRVGTVGRRGPRETRGPRS